ncbi:hypothetical protein [Nocardioides perillae]|uniref:Uncharacterized protein n=1 Tax=Nocardioides perillae TaxID=1119534 RepID=A0A7Y9RY71_9ACTN|nr:hypothetical protein [Nocardioides perillae]NYG56913.1 hypothetical protein [Nocardioides perillae]
MTQTPQDLPDFEPDHDQDAEPASRPDGGAASDGGQEEQAGDQDAGPASS